jgi:protein-S-isoprenylcysteine O-methyltransferase Ste14
MGNLIAKAGAGFLALMVILGLSMFLSAGSLRFWQAWVWLAVFGGCVIPITAYLARHDPRLLASRVKAGPVSETQKSQQIIQSLASLFFIALFIVPGLDFRFHWSKVPPAVSWLAEGMVALSLFFVFLVFRENSYTSGTIEVSEGQQVITTGPYSLVRHPMYAGASILLIFTPLALGSWVGIPFALPVMGVVIIRLLEEEKFLRASLGGYEAYCEKVRYRLIPFIW